MSSVHTLAPQVAAGRAHSLALCANGTVFAFGKTAAGQCGNGDTGDSAAPVRRPTRVQALAGLAVRDLLAAADASAAVVESPEGVCQLYRWGTTPSQPATVLALPVRASAERDGAIGTTPVLAGPGA